MRKAFPILFLLLSILDIKAQQNFQNLVEIRNGQLNYSPYTSQGDILPDFSYCGYRQGNTALPTTQAILQIHPVQGDNTDHIQKAIDSLSKWPLDKNGIRGAVLLSPGEYPLAKSIQIRHSGIILMGKPEEAHNTKLIATTPRKYTLISVGEREEPKAIAGTNVAVTDEYVPSGTKTLRLSDASKFKVGDAIIVERPSTKEWIEALGMDKIRARWSSVKGLSKKEIARYEKQGKLNKQMTHYNSVSQWEPGTKNLRFERTIIAIKGNQITLDIPLTNALQKEYGGGFVYKYTYKKRLSEIGIGHLSAISRFDSTIVKQDRYIGTYAADENHGWTCISMANAENSWIDNVHSIHFSFGFTCGKTSKNITIQNCSFLDPISIIEGGRRYGFNIHGQLCLVRNSYSRNGRHDFVMGALAAGPNAFVDCKAEMCHAASEPHHRWATGTLWDNCSLSGPMAYFSLSNRGNFGSGHGWAGAQMILWNCTTPLAVVMHPPTAQNFAFGTVSLQDEWTAEPTAIQSRVDRLNRVANKNFKYIGQPAVGDGWIHNNGSHVQPKSLYLQQLKDRLKQ